MKSSISSLKFLRMDEKRLVKYSYDWLAPVILVDMLNPSETERVNPRTET